MRVRFLLILALAAACAHPREAPAAFERQGEGVRSCAMGGAGVAWSGNVWGILMNPAGLARITGPVLAVAVSPAPFGLQELRRTSLAFAQGTDRFTAAVTATRYGFELYREITFGTGCGLDCGKGLRAGAALTLNNLSIAGYGSASCIGIDAGVSWEIAGGFEAGASASNLNAPGLGRQRETIPRTFQAGIACAVPGGLLLACDVAEDVRFPAEIRLGAEWNPAGFLSVRAGISTDPSVFSAGIAVRISPVEIEYALSRHEELGFTNRFGFSLRLGGL